MKTIESPANPTIRSLARLLQRRHREEEGRFIVEGRREADMAIAAGARIELAVVAPELGADPPDGVETVLVSPAAFRKVSVRANPDGMALVVSGLATDLERLAGCTLVLVADAMEKPGNIGAMLRTAEAAGAGVVVASPVTDIVNPNVIRASQGALFTVRVAVAEAAEARRWLEERMAVVVASPRGSAPYWEADLRGPIAIVVGAEHRGVSAAWSGLREVAIPMAGSADSLNASVAAAVILYEAVRQRGRPTSP